MSLSHLAHTRLTAKVTIGYFITNGY